MAAQSQIVNMSDITSDGYKLGQTGLNRVGN